MKKSKSKTIFIFTIFLTGLLLPKFLWAATINAMSCSQTDVQVAIDAASDGDTVTVPTGTCTWVNLIPNNPALKIFQKAIILQGAGAGLTKIISNTGLTGAESLISITGIDGKKFRVTGFTFDRNNLTDSDTYYILISGTSKNWRVDHNEFIGRAFGSPDAAVHTAGETYGVIDHNILLGSSRITVNGNFDSSWKLPLSLGTEKAVYIEDNEYLPLGGVRSMNAIDAVGGARFVFRYNKSNNAYVEAHGINWQGARSTFSYEIYNNDITDGPDSWVPVAVRGGTGVIFNNIFHGFVSGSNKINIYNDRSCRDDSPQDGVCDGGNFTCNGNNLLDANQIEDSGTHTGSNNQPVLLSQSRNWTNNTWKYCTIKNTTDGSSGQVLASDTNTITTVLAGGFENDWDNGDSYSLSCGYSCLDQIGRSVDSSLSNFHPQALEPLYEWNNYNDGLDTDIIYHSVFLLHPKHLVEGRDFFNDTPRPGYIPYVYPHPLALSGGDIIPPAAPTGIIVS